MPTDRQIDPRGPRFGAFVTLALVLIALMLGPSTAGLIVMGALVALFLPGAIVGPQATAQGWVFKTFIRPRLAPPAHTESFRPPRFAQQVGLAMSALALILGLLGVAAGFWVFAIFVAVASFLNGVFDFCLGCEMYLLFARLRSRAA